MLAPVESQSVDISRLEGLADGELVLLLKQGYEEALGVLLRRHADALYRFCCHLMPNREDAEDICQESMAKAIVRADSLHTGAAFRSWLFSIARNLSIDTHRARKRLTPLPDEEDGSPIMLYHDDAQERLEIGEEHQTVADALNRLARSHQTVLMMREVEGLSYAEIAHRLDVSQSAVETLLFRARRRLKAEYLKKAAPSPAFGVAGVFRGLLSRLPLPFSGGAPLAAKMVATAVLVGAAISAPRVLPLMPQVAFGHRTVPSGVASSASHRNGSVATAARAAAGGNGTVYALRHRSGPHGDAVGQPLAAGTRLRTRSGLSVRGTTDSRSGVGRLHGMRAGISGANTVRLNGGREGPGAAIPISAATLRNGTGPPLRGTSGLSGGHGPGGGPTTARPGYGAPAVISSTQTSLTLKGGTGTPAGAPIAPSTPRASTTRTTGGPTRARATATSVVSRVQATATTVLSGAGATATSVSVKLPGAVPTVTVLVPTVVVKVPTVVVKVPTVVVKVPTVTVKVPTVTVKVPTVSVKVPTTVPTPVVKAPKPTVSVKLPTVPVKVPTVQVKTATPVIKLPTVAVPTPGLHIP